MRRMRLLLLAAALGLAAIGARAEDLAQGFQSPPDSAKPHTWWHWMNGNITKEGITADLEAMKKAGVGGAQIFNVDCGIPAGDVKVMSPEWREMIKHAISEANRLGIELCIHNCPGWSSSGGPWNTPEHAMQKIVTSEQQVTGPGQLSIKLPQPQANAGYYEDIAVLAFRNPAGATGALKAAAPKITASDPRCKAAQALDGKEETNATLPLPTRRNPQYLQLEFAKPFTAQTLMLTVGKGMTELAMTAQASDDGKKFRTLRSFSKSKNGTSRVIVALGDAPVRARFFRLVFNRADQKVKRIGIAEIALSPAVKIESLDAKIAGTGAGNVKCFDTPAIPADQAIDPKATIDLTGKMDKTGQLAWDAPEGEWTILRVGHTFTGKNNHPAPAEGTGPEVDKMSAEAFDLHWAGMMQKIIDDVGPLAGKSLNNSLIDSYEVNGQNWTPKMREEFKKRRGYDMFEFLPVFTGRIVRSSEETERFLWDLRRTVSDLFAENYYGRFAELCHKNHLNASIEPYTGPFESLQVGAPADIPMGEFWSGSGGGNSSTKLAASVAHIYGRKFVGAESFTARPENGKWQNDPWSFKALGDALYCGGINRYIYHRYAMQPWQNVYPGMTMGQWGFHFERTNGWWDQGTAWLKYCARCQYLLQSGRFVADAAYFMGEDAPSEGLTRDKLYPALPEGNDYDVVGRDVLVKGARVEDGQLVLASGMRYRVLVLPPGKRMRPETLATIKELAEAGLTVVGPRPTQSPSLQNYPKCDQELKTLADAMWGGEVSIPGGERQVGKGKIVWGKSMEDVFAGLNVKPDFDSPADARMLYIHRSTGDAEIYFVSSQRLAAQDVACTFRTAGMVPELWHPDTGKMETAPVWSEAKGCVTLPIHFDPAGSVFVVFRQKAAGADHAAEVRVAAAPEEKLAAQPRVEIVKAVYEALDGAGSMDVTARLNDLLAAGKAPIVASNAMAGKDPAHDHVKRLRVEYTVDGKVQSAEVDENRVLELPVGSGSLSAFPACTLAADGGKLVATAWRPATITAKTAAGKSLSAEVKALPRPLEVTGAWDVAFPPKWGAPEKATFEKLISWPDSPDQGIKYFSGTATYTKKLEIPAEMLGEGRLLALDLGDVKNFAQVSLNGQDLGILWKFPYRVDITKAAKAGENTLEVKVTNMWCNRLIGDEQLPDDCEWNGKQLKAWPAWLPEYLKSGKRPSSGRFTFTTWHHFDKDSPLFPAGLVGPVVVRAAQQVEVK